jgi:hypothetical protein
VQYLRQDLAQEHRNAVQQDRVLVAALRALVDARRALLPSEAQVLGKIDAVFNLAVAGKVRSLALVP